MKTILNSIARFNFWENKVYDIGYKRKNYTSKIASYFGNFLIKVLLGQRRVGKSYILR